MEPLRSAADGLPEVGVLALQGDFEAHARALSGLARVRIVKTPADLTRGGGVKGLILPGGESTTLVRLLRLSGLWDELRRRGAELPMFGTCAGAIILASEVEGIAGARGQDSLGLLDATIRRNAYGRQVDSFEDVLPCPAVGSPALPVVCIRAPRFRRVGPGVTVLLEREGEPLWVRERRVWAATFHPELTSDSRVHQAFVSSLTE